MHVITLYIPNYTPPMLRVYEKQIYKPSPPPPPLPGRDILRLLDILSNTFRHLVNYLFYICLFAIKILWLEKITGHQTYVPSEFWTVNLISFNSRYVFHGINTIYVTRRFYGTR